MLDSNIVLGIRRTLGCDEYEHGITTQSKDGWSCGVPVVFPTGFLNEKPDDMFRVMALFTPAQNAPGIESVGMFTKNIVRSYVKPLCGNHKVVEVGEFDLGKYDRLMQFIRDVGGISLIIESPKGRENITKSIFSLTKKWEYSSTFLYNDWGMKFLDGEDDKYVCVLTFLNLPYCVPLFNMRKVDGIGLSFSGATINASKAYGQLHRTFRADIIFSNYQDNVFFLDGVEINRHYPLDKNLYKELDKAAKLLPPVKPTKDSSLKEALAKDSWGGMYNKRNMSYDEWQMAKAEMATVEHHSQEQPMDPTIGPTIEIIDHSHSHPHNTGNADNLLYAPPSEIITHEVHLDTSDGTSNVTWADAGSFNFFTSSEEEIDESEETDE